MPKRKVTDDKAPTATRLGAGRIRVSAAATLVPAAKTAAKAPAAKTVAKAPPAKTATKAPAATKSRPSLSPEILSSPKVAAALKVPQTPAAEVKKSGSLLVFGNNDSGQIGFEEAATVKRYPFVFDMARFGEPQKSVQKLACGGMHSIVVDTSGTAYTFGCNDEGALGTGKAEVEDSEYMPKKVPIAGEIADVSAGDSHTAFLTEDGQIYLTGTMRDQSGAFGLKFGEEGQQLLPFLFVDRKTRTPDKVAKDHAVQMSSGANHFGYRNKKGEVHLLGDMSNGQLGPISTYRETGGRDGKAYFLQRRRVFVQVPGPRPKFRSFSDIWCTPYGTFVKDATEDKWFACGNNLKNQLGFPNEHDGGVHVEWKEVEGLQNKHVKKIVGTYTHTIALTTDGKLYVFGAKEYLGLSSSKEPDVTSTEQPVLLDVELHFVDIACSSNNSTLAITKEGDLYAWGSPSSGLVGTDPDDADLDAVMVPTKIDSKNTKAFHLLQVAAGASHALLVGKVRAETTEKQPNPAAGEGGAGPSGITNS